MTAPNLNIPLFERELLGDSNTTGLATSALSELLSAGGQLASGFQKQKETSAATAQATAKQQAALATAQQAAQNAQSLRMQATLAAAQAKGESDPNGPLHLAAIKADLDATNAEKQAQNLATAAGQSYTGTGTGLVPGAGAKPGAKGGHSFLTKQAGPLKVWEWGLVSVITFTVLGGVVVYARRK